MAYIDRVFVINMDHDVARLSSFTSLMRNLKIKFERFPAVNGQAYKPKKLSPGEYGCFMSHKKIWEIVAKDDDINKAIIFEDDIVLNSKLKNDYKHARKIIKHYCQNYTYDIFYLGKCLDRCDLHTSQGEGVVRTRKPLCTHSYVITKDTAIKLLKNCPEELNRALDNFVSDCIGKSDLLAYAAHPSIFVQDSVCYSSNLRSRFMQMILNTKECGVPKDSNYIYSFIALVSIIFIIIAIMWSVKRNQ